MVFCLDILYATSPPIDLYLISEKSSWKNQVQRTGFLVYLKLDFTVSSNVKVLGKSARNKYIAV